MHSGRGTIVHKIFLDVIQNVFESRIHVFITLSTSNDNPVFQSTDIQNMKRVGCANTEQNLELLKINSTTGEPLGLNINLRSTVGGVTVLFWLGATTAISHDTRGILRAGTSYARRAPDTFA